jgi:periplasmic protein TonB
MVLIPLIYTEALPGVHPMATWSTPSPPPPARVAAAPKALVHQVSMADLTKEPDIIPTTITKVKDRPVLVSIDVPSGVPGTVPGGQSEGPIGDIFNSMSDNRTPPPAAKALTPPRIRVSRGIERAKIIYQPEPDYPALAKMARVQGTVRFEALIAKDGTIQDLKVLSGHPLLVQSALAAVQQWRYQPTLLNGQPVEVETEIDVNFTLE